MTEQQLRLPVHPAPHLAGEPETLEQADWLAETRRQVAQARAERRSFWRQAEQGSLLPLAGGAR